VIGWQPSLCFSWVTASTQQFQMQSSYAAPSLQLPRLP
jgi:hypothetical protein